ncbi:MAG: putative zinc-binding protein [Candidatus Hodarchaeota archaeon]
MAIKPKIGLVSCCGECCSLGTVSRKATRKVLEDLKSRETITICLPLFLAGDAGERNFAREFPTVAVDGCHKLCATKAIENCSGKKAFTINVKALLDEWTLEPPASRRELTLKDKEIIARIAQEISRRIDVINGGLDDEISNKNGLAWRS